MDVFASEQETFGPKKSKMSPNDIEPKNDTAEATVYTILNLSSCSGHEITVFVMFVDVKFKNVESKFVKLLFGQSHE